MNFRLPKKNVSSLLLSAALIIAAALPLRGEIAKSYVPALQTRDGADLGLALVDPSLAEAKVSLTARDYIGATIRNNAIINPITLTLPASGQIAVRAPELFGSGISGQAGWVGVSASTPEAEFWLSTAAGVLLAMCIAIVKVPNPGRAKSEKGESESSNGGATHSFIQDVDRFYRRNYFWALVWLACAAACLLCIPLFVRVALSQAQIGGFLVWTGIATLLSAAYSFLYIANMFWRPALIAKCSSWRIQMAQTSEERSAISQELMKMMQKDIYSSRLRQPDGPGWLGIIQGIFIKNHHRDIPPLSIVR